MTTPLVTTHRVALNADVVGYSRLLADDFAATTAEMEDLRRNVTDVVERAGGTLVDFTGDNFMALFNEPETAVMTAIEIGSSGDVTSNGESRVRLRMGIDSGDVGEVDGKYFGDALNIAARIQAVAPAGGLSVSERVYRDLDEPELRFRSRGRQSFKNIPEQVEVFEFRDLPPDGSRTPTRDALDLESPTVAVLPIHTEGVEESARSQGALIRSDLIHHLSNVSRLTVVDAGPDKERPRRPARYVVEPGILTFGDIARIYVEVIEVSTWNIVKAHKRTTSIEDIVSVSEELATDVARSIEVDLIVGAPAALYAELDDPIAIEKIYRGWYLLTVGTKEDWERALELFESVRQSHPDQPYGYILSAFTNWFGAATGTTTDVDAAMDLAYEQAKAALEIGDPTGMADMVVAAVHLSRREYDEALDVLANTQISRATCDATYGLQGSVWRFMGDWEHAIEAADTAMRLTAVNKPWYPTLKACSLFHGGHADEAMSVAEEVVEYQPMNLEALLILAASQVELGLDRRAQATAQLVRERFPSVDIDSWLDENPYQDPEVIVTWKARLAEVGLATA